ncbi:MAG: hypothetical protein J0I32_09610 [Sphingobacteriales bacterium]|nr:hypothetical protein [Sphingobacteriales bacterium]OJW00256.1 MAG: hypothetical protein BGO52_03985 [Sphingobacteriales bacterium 44-61]
MHTLRDLAIYDHYKELMKKKEKTAAFKTIKEFFEEFPGDEPENHLWFMTFCALTSDEEELTALERNAVLYFHDCLRLVLNTLRQLNDGKLK